MGNDEKGTTTKGPPCPTFQTKVEKKAALIHSTVSCLPAGCLTYSAALQPRLHEYIACQVTLLDRLHVPMKATEN